MEKPSDCWGMAYVPDYLVSRTVAKLHGNVTITVIPLGDVKQQLKMHVNDYVATVRVDGFCSTLHLYFVTSEPLGTK